MAYTPINASNIQVGDSVKQELFQAIKDNFDNHETRIIAAETSGAVLEVFDEDVHNASSAVTMTNLLSYQAKRNIRITKVTLQIYEKGSVSSGILEMDVLKASSLGGTYASILTTLPDIDFSTAANFDATDGIINGSLNELIDGDYLRVDMTSLPTVSVGRWRIIVYGESY